MHKDSVDAIQKSCKNCQFFADIGSIKKSRQLRDFFTIANLFSYASGIGDYCFGQRIVVHPINTGQRYTHRNKVKQQTDDHRFALIEQKLLAAPYKNNFARTQTTNGKGNTAISEDSRKIKMYSV